MSLRFVREIPEDRIVAQKEQIAIYEQNGFTLIWKADSLEIYADC